jgi:hypothetical protein
MFTDGRKLVHKQIRSAAHWLGKWESGSSLAQPYQEYLDKHV